MAATSGHERATHLSKLELFNQRATLKRASTTSDAALSNLSFYAFSRMFDVASGRLLRKLRAVDEVYGRRAIATVAGAWPAFLCWKTLINSQGSLTVTFVQFQKWF